MSKAADAFGHQNGHSRKRKTAGDLLDMLKESLGTHRSYKLAKFEKPNPYNQNSRTKKMELPKKNVQELIPGFAIHQSDELSEAEKEQLQRMPQLVAIDCEMVCSLGEPMALARCTVVALDGKCLLDEFVKPRTKIINFVSRYSGIYPRHMVNATPYYKAKEKVSVDLFDQFLLEQGKEAKYITDDFSFPCVSNSHNVSSRWQSMCSR